jgi:MSHA pilin protein MshA
MQTMKSQQGFTLIELVVVITILGILAAFAVPRFAGLQVDAREAAVQALAGSIRSGAALAHALWLANNQVSPVNMEGSNIVIANGYPNRATIDDALTDWQSGFNYAPGTGIFTKIGASVPANCAVQYTAPAALGQPPQVTVTTTQC